MKNPHIFTVALTLGLIAFVSRLPLGAQQPSETDPDAVVQAQPKNTDQLPASEPQALQLIQDARSRLYEYQSVQADVELKVSFGDYRFLAEGQYFAGQQFKSRLEYTVTLSEMKGLFIEVSDGQVLHTVREISLIDNDPQDPTPPELDLTRRDIQKILNAVKVYEDQPEAVRAAEIGIGGLTAMLASLERTMIFTEIEQATDGDHDVVKITGQWNPNERTRLIGGLGGIASQIDQFVPERVQVTFNQQTLVPEKIQYLKQAGTDSPVFSPILTVSVSNVVLNQPIPQQRFSYVTPAGKEERDETSLFIQAIQEASSLPANARSRTAEPAQQN